MKVTYAVSKYLCRIGKNTLSSMKADPS